MVPDPIDADVGNGAWGSVADTLPAGATEREWLLDGEATRFRLVGDYRADGKWQVEPEETAAFRTRVLVELPPADQFNGIVVVVWNNVSAGFDGMFAGAPTDVMLRDGYAVAGVSAQYVGVQGDRGLVNADPERYGTLHHPGDDYSYDIFVQATRAISGRGSERNDLLGGLAVRFVVASGASQSAGRLATLHNAFHPAGLVDAYHLPVYFGNGTVVDSTAGEDAIPGGSPNPAMRMLPFGMHGLRDDLGVPVFILNSETEAHLFTANLQPDSDHLVIWENAGASHIGSAAGDNRFGLPETRCRGSFAPSQRAVWHHLRRWLEEGVVPPSQPRLERNPDGTMKRDEHGNALGGIRWPHVVVPLGTHRGDSPPGAPRDLMGSTTPFDADQIRTLYADRGDYDARFAAALEALTRSGVVLPDDAPMVTDTLTGTAWA